jgi:NADPH-dependent F420 reductase
MSNRDNNNIACRSALRIGIIGGTGGMGKGFALRWCPKHEILIGSRDAQRASASASEYVSEAQQVYGKISGSISGKDNLSVAQESDVLILAIPYENIDSVCSELLGKIKDNCTVISPIVPMTKTDVGFEFIPLKENKPFSHQLVQKYMKNKLKLVSAFHVISEKKLVDPKFTLDYDIFVCGDDKESIEIVNGLILEIKGLRPIFLGSGALAYMAEIATPLLLNAMIKNKMKNPGIKIL